MEKLNKPYTLLIIFVIDFNNILMDIKWTPYFYVFLLISIVNKGIGNNIWGCSAGFITGGIKRFFSIEGINERFSGINNKGIRKGFWDCNVGCGADKIGGSLLIDNINNKPLKIVLFEINKLFIILFDTNIESVIVKGILIIDMADKDNESFIVYSVIIKNNCV